MELLDEEGHEAYHNAEFELQPSLRDLLLLGEDTYASVQCQIVELGPIGAEDRPRRTMSVTDVPEEGEAALTERCLAQDNG